MQILIALIKANDDFLTKNKYSYDFVVMPGKICVWLQLGSWDGVPLEIEAPVEASPDQRTGGVVEGVGVDDVNYGRDHVSPGTPYTVQQGLQPIDIHFNMAGTFLKKLLISLRWTRRG